MCIDRVRVRKSIQQNTVKRKDRSVLTHYQSQCRILVVKMLTSCLKARRSTVMKSLSFAQISRNRRIMKMSK